MDIKVVFILYTVSVYLKSTVILKYTVYAKVQCREPKKVNKRSWSLKDDFGVLSGFLVYGQKVP